MRISVGILRDFCLDLCRAHKIPEHHAVILVDSLVDADCAGKQTHGVMRLVPYLERGQRGLVDVKATPVIQHDSGALMQATARNGYGAVAMDWALGLLRKRASQYGIAGISMDHGNHIGALGYWTRQLALGDRPLVAMVVSDATPRLPPTGGMDPLLGNNPWSIAIPKDGDQAFVLDMANSVAAFGKIRQAKASGESIPEGWALDRDGQPTTDPSTALEGLLLPMAGYKGYVITFMMGLLANVVSQADSVQVRSLDDFEGPQNLSHWMMAVDLTTLYGPEGLERSLNKAREWARRIQESRHSPGVEHIWLPGEQSQKLRRESIAAGIPLKMSTLDSLNRMAESLGVAPLVP